MQIATLNKMAARKTGSKLAKLFMAGIITVTAGAASAQNGLDFSLRGLVQTSSLINSKDQGAGPEVDYKMGVTMGGGVSVGYTFSKHLGAELGVLYSKQGQGYTGDFAEVSHNTLDVTIISQEFERLAVANNITSTGKYTANIEFTNIKVPILLRFTGDNTRKSFFSGFIGPQVNMMAQVKTTINGKEAQYKNMGVKYEDIYKKTSVDAVLGLGVTFKLTENFLLSGHFRLDCSAGDVENKNAKDPNGRYNFYDKTRGTNYSATGGAVISISYKLVKKAPKDDKTKTKVVEKTKKK